MDIVPPPNTVSTKNKPKLLFEPLPTTAETTVYPPSGSRPVNMSIFARQRSTARNLNNNYDIVLARSSATALFTLP